MADKNHSGDSNQITREYFDSLLIEMRHIDAVLPSTALSLYSESFSTPVMTAALSHLDNHRPNGTVEMAQGVVAANTVMWTGMGGEAELDSIIATGARTIKIIKPYADKDVIFRKIAHAEEAGALAIGMDLDHSFSRKGQYDNVLGEIMTGMTIEDLRRFVDATRLPFIIKGVLSEKDAYKCMEAGIQGIVVSHHHGIQDYAVPPLQVLPKIVRIVENRIPIFVDCGVSSGMDVFKALALGATAVCVGRDLMQALVEGGATGVEQRIGEITQELAGAMARTASADLQHIDSDIIWKR